MTDSVQVAVCVVDGKVIAKWHKPVRHIVFDPQNAYTVGMALSKAAMEAHRGVAMPGDVEFINGELATVKVKISDARRDLLIAQVATIIRSLLEQGRSPGYIALHSVDTVLQETAR